MPSKLLINGDEITDSKSIADRFNDFFANIGNALTRDVPCIDTSPMSFMISRQVNSLFLNPTSSNEIEQQLCYISPSTEENFLQCSINDEQ